MAYHSDDVRSDDDTVSVITPPPSASIDIGRCEPHDRQVSTRNRTMKRLSVLVVTTDPKIAKVIDDMRSVSGVGAYEMTCASDAGRASAVLSDPGWQAYVLDESSFHLTSSLTAADRERILKLSVVVTALGAAGAAAMTGAECIPRERLTRFSLDHALSRIARYHASQPSRSKERETLQDILWKIARSNLSGAKDVTAALHPLVETAARLLKLGRASVWQILDEPKRLRCLAMFDPKTGEVTSGIEVLARDCPGYCAALQNHRIMSISDATHDERSSELVDIYLRASGIGALLDAPIYLDGEVVGLFCCAHVGGIREWTEAEQYIAATMSDYAQLVLMAHRRRQAEEMVLAQQVRMQHGQRLEALGIVADMAIARLGTVFSHVCARVKHLVEEEKDTIPSPVLTNLLLILSECEGGAEHAKQLHALGPTAASSPTQVSLTDICGSVCALLRHYNNNRVAIDCQLPERHALLLGNAGEIQGAIFSLCLNALLSIPQGGRLGIHGKIIWANGGSGCFFDLTLRDTSERPLHELKAGLAFACDFAERAEGSITIDRGDDSETVTTLRIPLEPSLTSEPLCEARDIVVIDDSSDPDQSLMAMLTFFGHAPSCRKFHESIQFLRQFKSQTALVIIHARRIAMPVRECYRTLRLVFPGRVLVLGEDTGCSGIGSGGVETVVVTETHMTAVTAAIDALLHPSEPARGSTSRISRIPL